MVRAKNGSKQVPRVALNDTLKSKGKGKKQRQKQSKGKSLKRGGGLQTGGEDAVAAGVLGEVEAAVGAA